MKMKVMLVVTFIIGVEISDFGPDLGCSERKAIIFNP